MAEFLAIVFSFPTAVFTVLLIVVLFYWLLATFGMVDLGESDLDMGDGVDGGSASEHASALAGYLVAFGLNGVPISVVASLLVLVAWTLSALAAIWLLPWVPTPVLRWLMAVTVLLGAAGLSLIITARLVRPLRHVFRTRYAESHASLVGQECVIWTSEVTPQVGRAEVARRGAPLNIRVWAPIPNSLKRGDLAVIVEYDAAAHRFRVEAKS